MDQGHYPMALPTYAYLVATFAFKIKCKVAKSILWNITWVFKKKYKIKKKKISIKVYFP